MKWTARNLCTCVRPLNLGGLAPPPTRNIWACKETIVTWWLNPLICYSKWGMKYNTLYIVYTKWFLYWNNKAIFNLLTQYLQCFIIKLSWLTLSFWSGAFGVIFWTWWIRGFFWAPLHPLFCLRFGRLWSEIRNGLFYVFIFIVYSFTAARNLIQIFYISRVS